jgi:hypothetical protein
MRRREQVGLIIRPAILDRHVAAFNEASLAQSLAESG